MCVMTTFIISFRKVTTCIADASQAHARKAPSYQHCTNQRDFRVRVLVRPTEKHSSDAWQGSFEEVVVMILRAFAVSDPLDPCPELVDLGSEIGILCRTERHTGHT